MHVQRGHLLRLALAGAPLIGTRVNAHVGHDGRGGRIEHDFISRLEGDWRIAPEIRDAAAVSAPGSR